jgi:hypothetical protein
VHDLSARNDRCGFALNLSVKIWDSKDNIIGGNGLHCIDMQSTSGIQHFVFLVSQEEMLASFSDARAGR